MIVIGNPKISPERETLLRMGGILAFVPGDHVTRFWLGAGEQPNGRNVDLLFGEARADDGSMFLFGRARLHEDELLHDSKDHREVVQVACEHGMTDGVWDKAVQTIVVLSGLFGIEGVVQIQVDGGLEKFHKLFMERAPEYGFDISMVEQEVTVEEEKP